MKQCTKCKQLKPLDEFSTHIPHGRRVKYPSCRKCKRIYNKERYIENKEVHKAKVREYSKQHSEQCKLKRKEWASNNIEKRKEYGKRYRELNKERLTEASRLRKKERRGRDSTYRISLLIKRRILQALSKKSHRKKSRTKEIIGCSFEELKEHLVRTWKKNYPKEILDWKGIHIDHVIPLASAVTEEDIYTLNHWTNLQLLKAEDNIAKGARIPI